MCAAEGAAFTFVERSDMNAFALQDEFDIVGMHAGMFWMLCRLAATVAASGAFPAMAGETELRWSPDTQRSMQTPRELLEETTPFDWEVESAGWKHFPERQILFFSVLTILFRFLVFHELGHLHNDHGLRDRKERGSAPLMADRLGPPLIEASEGIASQAREIIADGHAMQMTLRSFDTMMDAGKTFELVRTVEELLRESGISRVSFVMTIINLFFRLSDRSDWESLPVDQLTHPPAPFRMKALLALLVDKFPSGIGDHGIGGTVKGIIVTSDALMSAMLQVYPKLTWLKSITSPAHDRHFDRLSAEYPRWIGRLGAADPGGSASARP